MGNKYAKIVAQPVDQKTALPGRETEMVKNNAGGIVFEADQWKQLERFLILGTEGGTYYVNETKHTRTADKMIDQCIKENPALVMMMLVEISANGRAFKNDPAEYVLAKLIAAKGEARQYGWSAMPAVIRTGRTLLEFSQLLDTLGEKWPMSRRKAFANWYDSKLDRDVAYQALKYPTSGKWSHRDLLRLCHPKNHSALYKYMVGKESNMLEVPQLVAAWEEIKKAKTVQQAVAIIVANKLTWEFVPGEWQGKKEVWEALLPNLPYTALIRNLGRMTSYGLLDGIGENVKFVRDKLANREGLRKARVHPMQALIAWKSYTKNGANRAFARENALTWDHNAIIADALENAFYMAFDLVEPSNKNMFLGIDVSGSMGFQISNLPITCAQAATVLAMVSLRTEQNSLAYGFDTGIKDMGLKASDNFDSAFKKLSNVNAGGTDCSLPMIYALNNGLQFDQFVVLTDNETWAGYIHPSEALKKYRQVTGIDAKLVVNAMVSSGFTIADPKDSGMLDVVGFDTTVPAVISKFAQGL